VLKHALIAVWLGGFAILGIVGVVLNAKAAFVVLGKLWFTSCMLLGIAYGCTHWFNPDRDPLHSSAAESWTVIVINTTVMLTAWMWFWED
jgi:hypothetical protein